MSKEKQIEEMAKDICRHYEEGDLCRAYSEAVECDCDCWTGTYLAPKLYDAGYRKQIKSEWVMIPVDGVARYRCGNINCCRLIPFGAQPSEMAYCPICGARMKGGE